jgi:hypothetical protein
MKAHLPMGPELIQSKLSQISGLNNSDLFIVGCCRYLIPRVHRLYITGFALESNISKYASYHIPTAEDGLKATDNKLLLQPQSMGIQITIGLRTIGLIPSLPFSLPPSLTPRFSTQANAPIFLFPVTNFGLNPIPAH